MYRYFTIRFTESLILIGEDREGSNYSLTEIIFQE